MKGVKSVSEAVTELDSELFRFQNLCRAFRHTGLSINMADADRDRDDDPAWADIIEMLRETILPPLEALANNVLKELEDIRETSKTPLDEAFKRGRHIQHHIKAIKNLLLIYNMAAIDEDENRYDEEANWASAFSMLLDIARKIEYLSENFWDNIKVEEDRANDNERQAAAQAG